VTRREAAELATLMGVPVVLVAAVLWWLIGSEPTCAAGQALVYGRRAGEAISTPICVEVAR